MRPVLFVAAVGFLFDTYELLMFPVIGGDAVSELKGVPITDPAVKEWGGRMLWIAALCGGVFGLLGGWLIDRLGRKTVMVAAILMYSVSPVCAAFSSAGDVRPAGARNSGASGLPVMALKRSPTFFRLAQYCSAVSSRTTAGWMPAWVRKRKRVTRPSASGRSAIQMS